MLFPIDEKVIHILLSMLKNKECLTEIFDSAIRNMTEDVISFYIDAEQSVTDKEIWLSVSREHLIKETEPNPEGWNEYPLVIPWEDREVPERKLWLVRLKDGRFVSGQYCRSWKKWPAEKISYFREPSDPPAFCSGKHSELSTSHNDWLPYPEYSPSSKTSYEVYLTTGEVRTSVWRGGNWSYFNNKIRAFKPIIFKEN